MFCTAPSSGTCRRRNMSAPRAQSMPDSGCGVVTSSAPLGGMALHRVSWMSPVPGGISTSSMSSCPHPVCRPSWRKALLIMGPRQAMEAAGSATMAMDISRSPCTLAGSRRRRSPWPLLCALVVAGRPNSPGRLGP